MSDDPVIMVPVDEVLDTLDHGNNWAKGAWTDHDGRMCLHQGIRACQVQPGDALIIERVAERQGWGTDFNDADGTTFDDVKQRLVEHREVFPHELEETFGPQWLAIVALVRRAATLTKGEAAKVGAVYDAVYGVVYDTARGAAYDAAYDAARGAAYDAAYDAARGAVYGAVYDAVYGVARGAAEALVVRDLVGQHGFTQGHYDLLAGPWASVIGPVHPDD